MATQRMMMGAARVHVEWDVREPGAAALSHVKEFRLSRLDELMNRFLVLAA